MYCCRVSIGGIDNMLFCYRLWVQIKTASNDAKYSDVFGDILITSNGNLRVNCALSMFVNLKMNIDCKIVRGF